MRAPPSGPQRAAHVVGVFAHPDRDRLALELGVELQAELPPPEPERLVAADRRRRQVHRARAADRRCRRASAAPARCAAQPGQRRLALDADEVDRAPADLARRHRLAVGARARVRVDARARAPPRAAASPRQMPSTGASRATSLRSSAISAARNGYSRPPGVADAHRSAHRRPAARSAREVVGHGRACVERARVAARCRARASSVGDAAPALRSACAGGRSRASSRADHCPIGRRRFNQNRLTGNRMAEAHRRACRCRPPRRARAAPPYRVRRRRSDGPAAARCARTWCVRPACSRTRSERGRRAPLDHLPRRCRAGSGCRPPPTRTRAPRRPTRPIGAVSRRRRPAARPPPRRGRSSRSRRR